MDAMVELVAFIDRTRFEDLPPRTIEVTKAFVLDSLGALIAGTTAAGCKEVREFVREYGGKPESTVLVYGDKVPSFHAALVNGMMAHAREIDDTHDTAFMHTFSSILFASLAVAEARGGIDGRDLLNAVVLGVDLSCRIALATSRIGWATLWPSFGSAAASAKLLGMEKEKILDTLGIVLSQTTGNIQCALDGALVKRMQHGFAAMRGVFSAHLAHRGITGTRNILEGKYGFFQLYKRGLYDRERLLANLGEKFEVNELSFKPYPSCRCTHGPIDLALIIREQYALRAEDVEEVEVYLSPMCYDAVGKSLELGQNPQVDAQFSVPYTVAVAFARGNVFIEDFEEERIRDTRILDLAKKVQVKIFEGLLPHALAPVKMEVKLRDGRVLREEEGSIKGDPQNSLSFDEVATKFLRCCDFSVKQISNHQREEPVGLVRDLEGVKDVARSLVSLLS